MENTILNDKDNYELLSEKSILDCSTELDYDKHCQDTLKFLEGISSFLDDGSSLITKRYRVDQYAINTMPVAENYLFSKCINDFEESLQCLDLKNGIDFVKLSNENLGLIVYGQGYTLASDNIYYLITNVIEIRLVSNSEAHLFEEEIEFVPDLNTVNKKGQTLFNNSIPVDINKLMALIEISYDELHKSKKIR